MMPISCARSVTAIDIVLKLQMEAMSTAIVPTKMSPIFMMANMRFTCFSSSTIECV